MPLSLMKIEPAPTAVVLFTSGSETMPKAVPLTHENLLANIRSICLEVKILRNDRLMSFLPPFHSFGLTGGTLMPLCVGVPVVHHPNPTESPMLAMIIEAYKATIIIATPTFLSGVIRASTDEQMESFRLAVVGGEKCSQRVYDAFAQRCPKATILEGYGVTECSPFISVNEETNPKQGTIGKVLPSLEYAIVVLHTNY